MKTEVSRLKDQIKKLKRHNNNLKKENIKLCSNIRTLEKAWVKTSKQLASFVDNTSLENIIKKLK